MIATGPISTPTSISSPFVYLLLDSKKLQGLLEKLETAIPTPSKTPRQAELEQLPYLVGESVDSVVRHSEKLFNYITIYSLTFVKARF